MKLNVFSKLALITDIVVGYSDNFHDLPHIIGIGAEEHFEYFLNQLNNNKMSPVASRMAQRRVKLRRGVQTIRMAVTPSHDARKHARIDNSMRQAMRQHKQSTLQGHAPGLNNL